MSDAARWPGLPTFVRFLLAGGSAAAVNVAARLLFSLVLPYAAAIVAAYLAGMAAAYLLNRLLVFGAGDRGLTGEVAAFALVNLAGVAQTLGVSLLLARWLLPWIGVHDQAETLAHIVGVTVPVASSYVGHKYWTFRNHPR
jgi:putative flippase GtrA